MELTIRIAAGAAVFVGSCALAYFFYVLIRAPEDMNLFLANNRRHTLGSRAYLAVVAISWAAFAFSGAYGLLSWLPSEVASMLSGIVAFLSFGLLIYVERSAYTTHEFRRTAIICRELEKLIEYATIPITGTIERHSERAHSAKTLAEREAHKELAGLAALLAERDNKLRDFAVGQTLREVEVRNQKQRAIEKTAQAAVMKRERDNQFRRIIEQNMAMRPTTNFLNALVSDVEMLIEPNLVKQKWQPLYDFTDHLRRIGPTVPIQPLLKGIAGAHPKKDVNFELKLNGREMDGYYEVCSSDGFLADGLIFDQSLDGVMAAFFLRVMLPYQLAWGHGAYDRDRQVVTTIEQAVAILSDSNVAIAAPELRNEAISPGFRVHRSVGVLTLRCLGYRPAGFYEFAVSVANGNASETEEIKIFQWGHVFY